MTWLYSVWFAYRRIFLGYAVVGILGCDGRRDREGAGHAGGPCDHVRFRGLGSAMTEGYGKWLERARGHDVTREEQIVEALAEFIADQQLPENGDMVIRVRMGGEGQIAIERLDTRSDE